MPIALPLAIVGAAGLGYAATTTAANDAKKASETATSTNATTIANTQAANTAIEQPYEDRGNAAGNELNAFLGLDGTSGQDQAYSDYLNSTGEKFQLDQGSAAIDANASTSGLLKSGSTLKALDKYGQNVASTYSQNYLSDLATQQSAGAQAAGTNVSSNSAAAGANVANVNTGLQNTTAASTASTNALTNLLGQVTSAYGYSQGQSSYASGSATPSAANSNNAFAGLQGDSQANSTNYVNWDAG